MSTSGITVVALYVGASWTYLNFVMSIWGIEAVNDPDVSFPFGFAVLGLIGITSIPFVALVIVRALKPELVPDP